MDMITSMGVCRVTMAYVSHYEKDEEWLLNVLGIRSQILRLKQGIHVQKLNHQIESDIVALSIDKAKILHAYSQPIICYKNEENFRQLRPKLNHFLMACYRTTVLSNHSLINAPHLFYHSKHYFSPKIYFSPKTSNLHQNIHVQCHTETIFIENALFYNKMIYIVFLPKFTCKRPFLEKLHAPRAFISDNAEISPFYLTNQSFPYDYVSMCNKWNNQIQLN